VASPELAGFFLDEHIAHGVKFELGAKVALIKGESEVRGVGLADGTEIDPTL